MRKSVSPNKPLSVLPRVYQKVGLEERDVIIRKLKQDLILAKGKAKEVSILEHYLINLHEKTKLLQIQKMRIQEQNKARLEASIKVISEEKNTAQSLRNELKMILKELDQQEQTYDQLKKHVSSRNVQIEKFKKEGFYLYSQNQKLVDQNFKIRTQEENLINEIKRVHSTKNDFENRCNDINSKIIEVKNYLQELKTQEKILKEKLMTYQLQNNKIGVSIDRKQDEVDQLQHNFQQKHDQIKESIEHYIELQHKHQKCLQQTRHRLNLLKMENEKSQQINTYIDKVVNQLRLCEQERQSLNSENEQIDRSIRDYIQINRKMKGDLGKCSQHLQNLLSHNSLLNNELENYSRQDEGIINLIRYKRRPLILAESNRSVRTGRK